MRHNTGVRGGDGTRQVQLGDPWGRAAARALRQTQLPPLKWAPLGLWTAPPPPTGPHSYPHLPPMSTISPHLTPLSGIAHPKELELD
jgi:hypothetical protein